MRFRQTATAIGDALREPDAIIAAPLEKEE